MDIYIKEVTFVTYGGRTKIIDFTNEYIKVEGNLVRTLERLTDRINESQQRSGIDSDPIVRWSSYKLESK